MESPNANVELTFDQLQAIDTTQKRLANLQNEISVAAQNLDVARQDLEKVTKERIYQDELLKTVSQKVADLQSKYDTLVSTIEIANTLLSETTAKARTITAECEERLASIESKEETLKTALTEHTTNVEVHTVRSKQLAEDIEAVNNAKNILKTAIESITL